eukprot:8837795-Ditylum_brightwellii.AAC.1
MFGVGFFTTTVNHTCTRRKNICIKATLGILNGRSTFGFDWKPLVCIKGGTNWHINGGPYVLST